MDPMNYLAVQLLIVIAQVHLDAWFKDRHGI
jgi:hypothetical protein